MPCPHRAIRAAGDTVEVAFLDRRKCEYLYKEGDGSFVFMDSENYEQITLQRDLIENEAPWLEPNIKVVVQYIGGETMGIELPKMLDVEVTETELSEQGKERIINAKTVEPTGEGAECCFDRIRGDASAVGAVAIRGEGLGEQLHCLCHFGGCGRLGLARGVVACSGACEEL